MLALIKGAKNKFSRSTGNAYKIKEGKTRIRILPVQSASPLAVPGQFWMESGVHWIKTEANGKPVAVVGNSLIVYGTASPVEQAIERAIKSATSDDDLKLMKEWKAKTTILVNALIRSGSDASEDPVPLELTPTTFGKVLSMMDEYEAEAGNILDYKTGFDFTIERNGKGLNTEYTVMPHQTAKPVSKDSVDKAIDLFAFVEKEFFRGDETKAITAISNMSGISTAGLVGVAGPRTAGLLTRSSATVEDASLEAAAAAKIATETAAANAAAKAAQEAADAVAAELVADDVVTAPVLSKAAQLRAQMEAAEAEEAAETAAAAKVATAKAAAVKAAAAKAAKAAAPATAPAADTFGAPLEASEVDSILGALAEL